MEPWFWKMFINFTTRNEWGKNEWRCFILQQNVDCSVVLVVWIQKVCIVGWVVQSRRRYSSGKELISSDGATTKYLFALAVWQQHAATIGGCQQLALFRRLGTRWRFFHFTTVVISTEKNKIFHWKLIRNEIKSDGQSLLTASIYVWRWRWGRRGWTSPRWASRKLRLE